MDLHELLSGDEAIEKPELAQPEPMGTQGSYAPETSADPRHMVQQDNARANMVKGPTAALEGVYVRRIVPIFPDGDAHHLHGITGTPSTARSGEYVITRASQAFEYYYF